MTEEFNWADIVDSDETEAGGVALDLFDDTRIEALRTLVLDKHSLDVRITPDFLFQNSALFIELAEVADEFSLYIYTYDVRSNTPSLWVLQDLEYTFPDIVSASLVNFDISANGRHYVRSKVIGRVDIWATNHGLETRIEGVRQVFLPKWMEMDAFVIEHGRSLADIRTDVLIATGLAISQYKSINPNKPLSNPNTQNPGHNAKGNEPVTGVNSNQPPTGLTPADGAQLAGEGEAEPEPAGEFESAA